MIYDFKFSASKINLVALLVPLRITFFLGCFTFHVTKRVKFKGISFFLVVFVKANAFTVL